MKRFITFLIVICFSLFAGKTFGQNTVEKKNDRKGGFAVGGYDQARKAVEPTRSMEVREESEKSLKNFEEQEAMEAKKEVEKADSLLLVVPQVKSVEGPVPASPDAKGKETDKNKKGNAANRKKDERVRSENDKSKQKSKKDSGPESK